MRTHRIFLVATLVALPSGAAAAVPDRVWGTYVGGEADEILLAPIAVDEAGYIYIAGYTSSTTGIATPGAYKETKVGDSSNVYLMKFDPEGQRVWGTYYHHGIVYDLAVRGGKVVVAGHTTQATGIATAGAFDTEMLGIADGFAACFSTDGAFLWGTYIGGTLGMQAEDNAYAVAIDPGGDVFVAGDTSTGSGVGSAGAHQVNFGGSKLDAFLIRLGDVGQRIWGTHYGGAGNDLGKGLALGPDGALYLSGWSGSTTKIATPGTSQTANAGQGDGFIARFDTDGVRVWGTYFGGAAHDVVGLVDVHPDGGVVFVGFGDSTGIATPGVHQEQPGGEKETYVARIDAAGIRLWSTFLGGPGSDYPSGVAVTPGGAIYVSGNTTSASGIASPDGYQTFMAFQSTHLVRFDEAGKRVWGTYYGGPDSITEFGAVAVSGSRLYLSGSAGATMGIATQGTHKPTLTGPDDHFLVRFQDGDLGLPCLADDNCDSGHCVDGVCCDSACANGVCTTGICAPEAETSSTSDTGDTSTSDTGDTSTTTSATDTSTTTTSAGALTDDTGSTSTDALTTGATTSSTPTTTGGTSNSHTTVGDSDGNSATGTDGDPADTATPTGDPIVTSSSTTSTSADDPAAYTAPGCGCTAVTSPPALVLILALPRRRQRRLRDAAGADARMMRG